MNEPWLLFLHGINARMEDLWSEPLNSAIVRAGHEGFPRERVIAPDYRAALRGTISATRSPRNTWKNPGKEKLRLAETAYLSKMAILESKLRPLSGAARATVQRPKFDKVPPVDAVLGDASRYTREASVRDAVREIALNALGTAPKGAELVIIGHSLGSVIAADILKKLPDHLHVSALITIGSPLGAISDFRNGDLAEFPLDRVGSWVNLFDPRDPITSGTGISGHYPWAIDMPITLQDWMVPTLIHQHGAEYYCSDNSVGTAIAVALVGADLVEIESDPVTNVRGLELPLLQSLYLRELAKRVPADIVRVARLERAREVTAADHAAAAALLHERNPDVSLLPPAEFLRRPDAHIRGAWDDHTVVALAIMLASAPPAPPFNIESKFGTEERRRALVSTLSLIRKRSTEHTDVDIEDAVHREYAAVRELFAEGRSWVPVALVGAGVLTLAATGIGLVAAAPAGLAGAAVITSTLAAFGPGGMVGGMATLAALAGVGSAMAAGGGAALGVAGTSRSKADLFNLALDEAISSGDSANMRNLLISLLTLTATQERLKFQSQRERVLHSCLNAKASLALRAAAHEAIDPKSNGAKSVGEMLKLLEKACRWLRGEEKATSAEAQQRRLLTASYRDALDGRPDALVQVLNTRSLESNESPAITQDGK